jgi:hypothetical protein
VRSPSYDIGKGLAVRVKEKKTDSQNVVTEVLRNNDFQDSTIWDDSRAGYAFYQANSL